MWAEKHRNVLVCVIGSCLNGLKVGWIDIELVCAPLVPTGDVELFGCVCVKDEPHITWLSFGGESCLKIPKEVVVVACSINSDNEWSNHFGNRG